MQYLSYRLLDGIQNGALNDKDVFVQLLNQRLDLSFGDVHT